jgi:hypothetical protein
MCEGNRGEEAHFDGDMLGIGEGEERWHAWRKECELKRCATRVGGKRESEGT